MRKLSLSGVAFAIIVAGCCNKECGTSAPADTKAESTECPDCCCTTPSRADLLASTEIADKVELKVIKFDAFMKDVAAHRGKVVCAYQWTSKNPASRKNLPLLLELQRKLGKDGLVCVTASSDLAKDGPDAFEQLKSAQCDLVNYLQDENDPVDGWTSCFGCCGFPALVVFGRDGKKAATFEVTELPFEAATIEATVVKLLNVK